MMNRTGGAVVGLGVAPTTYQRDFVGAEVVVRRGGARRTGESAKKRDEKIGESIEGNGGERAGAVAAEMLDD